MEGRFLRRIAAAFAAFSLLVPAYGAFNLPQAQAANSGGTQQMFRMYNRISHEHLYTADANERDILSRGDWTYEGVGWVAPVKSATPVYRLYNPALGDHHYTTDCNEVKVLTASYGWKSEGTGWYSSDGKEVPVYRQFNPGLRVGSHNYTTDINEYNVNNARNGWKGEGVAWYAVQQGWQKGKEPLAQAAAEPTAADKDGKATDTFTIPSTSGVTYSVGGKTLKAGTYQVSDYATYANNKATITVTATATNGTRLPGTSQWNFTFDELAVATAKDVTYTDQTGSANDTFTIPNSPGVLYYVGNTAVSAGTHKVSEVATYSAAGGKATFTVTARAASGYRLEGKNSWPLTFDSESVASANAVAFDDRDGMANDTFTIPRTTGINYAVNGRALASGIYKVSDYATYTNYKAPVKIQATATPGYRVNGTSSWAHTFDGLTEAPTKAATFVDKNGMASDTFTIPDVAGIQYKAGGKNVAAGTHAVGDYFAYGRSYSVEAEITASAKAGFRLTGANSWAKTISGITTVAPTAATFSDKNGTANDTFTVPAKDGVQYRVNEKNIAAGTYQVADYFEYGSKYLAPAAVAAVPKAGYALSGTTQWTKAISGITTVNPAAVTFTDENGMGADTFTVPNRAGVQYRVNGKNIARGTYKVADYFDYGTKYSVAAAVVAVPKAGYALSGTTQWSETISGITTVSAEAATFTDKNGTASDTFTVPNVAGVQYKAGGKNVAAGTHKVADYFDYGTAYSAAAKVTAVPKAGYALSGTTQWSKAISGITTVTPEQPTFEDKPGREGDTITIPSQAGVQYAINGSDVQAGKHRAKDVLSYVDGRGEATITARAHGGYVLIGEVTWKTVFGGELVAEVKAPIFTDRDGVAQDTVEIPDADGIYYTINGQRAEPGVHVVAGYENNLQTINVHAYAEEGYAVTFDEATWFTTFNDGTTLTTLRRESHATSDFGSMTLAQATVALNQYRADLEGNMYWGSDYSNYTSIAQVLGADGLSVNQGFAALGRYSDASRELEERFQIRYQMRLSQVRERVGLQPVRLMRLSDEHRQHMFEHAVYTQDKQKQGAGSYVTKSPTLWAVVHDTYANRGGGMGWDGSSGQVGESLTWGTQSRYSLQVTPEYLADEAILDQLSEYENLSSTSAGWRVRLMLNDTLSSHYPLLYVYGVQEDTQNPAASTVSFLGIDDACAPWN